MAGGKSKVARLQETPAKKSRKHKPPKASSGMFEARAPELLENLEPKSEVSAEVQESPVSSQGDPAPKFHRG